MVTGAHPLKLALVGLGLLLSALALHAKDLASYQVGDTAGENITTPVALDVIDVDATAARKAAEALKTPAIFRSHPSPTNVIAGDFLAAFDQERALFTANLHRTFGEITNADETVASPAFKSFVTVFNRKKNHFAISAELAGVWAHGESGEAIRSQILKPLLQMARRPVRPDDLPPGLELGETLRLVPVAGPKSELTLADAELHGQLVAVTSVATVTHLRDLFRREFSQPDQSMARGVGKFLLPNCEPDARLTQQARDRDTSQLVVANHYAAGQAIVSRGEIIDAKALAAIAQLNEKLMPDQLNSQLAAQREQLQRELALREQLRQEQARTQGDLARTEAEPAAGMMKIRDEPLPLQNQAPASRPRNEWLLVAIAGIATAALVAVWLLARHRRRAASLLPVRAESLSPQLHELLSADLTPHLTQILKEAVVQGLAAQRNELLLAQQAAAAEIGALVHRLDELKAPMRERLRFYEDRIVELQKDLAERNEENRELLKLKIEMTRRQIESERARNRVDFN